MNTNLSLNATVDYSYDKYFLGISIKYTNPVKPNIFQWALINSIYTYSQKDVVQKMKLNEFMQNILFIPDPEIYIYDIIDSLVRLELIHSPIKANKDELILEELSLTSLGIDAMKTNRIPVNPKPKYLKIQYDPLHQSMEITKMNSTGGVDQDIEMPNLSNDFIQEYISNLAKNPKSRKQNSDSIKWYKPGLTMISEMNKELIGTKKEIMKIQLYLSPDMKIHLKANSFSNNEIISTKLDIKKITSNIKDKINYTKVKEELQAKELSADEFKSISNQFQHVDLFDEVDSVNSLLSDKSGFRIYKSYSGWNNRLKHRLERKNNSISVIYIFNSEMDEIHWNSKEKTLMIHCIEDIEQLGNGIVSAHLSSSSCNIYSVFSTSFELENSYESIQINLSCNYDDKQFKNIVIDFIKDKYFKTKKFEYLISLVALMNINEILNILLTGSNFSIFQVLKNIQELHRLDKNREKPNFAIDSDIISKINQSIIKFETINKIDDLKLVISYFNHFLKNDEKRKYIQNILDKIPKPKSHNDLILILDVLKDFPYLRRMTGHLYSEELINNLLNLNIPLNKVQNRDRIENLYASIYRSLHEKEINSKKVYDSCKELLSILNLKESEIKLTKIYEIILKLK